MGTIKKIAAITFEDNSTGETGMTPLDEIVHGYFDTLEEAVKVMAGINIHCFKEVEIDQAELDDTPDDIDQHHPGRYADPNKPVTEEMLRLAEARDPVPPRGNPMPGITVWARDDKTGIEIGINASGDLFLGNHNSGYNLDDTDENRAYVELDFRRYTGKEANVPR